jgi:hypothetical protein
MMVLRGIAARSHGICDALDGVTAVLNAARTDIHMRRGK